tara:strand:+ start:56 stop:352 length:297 start_codon:yes stop_codon:yes gene_type:complete
MMLLWRCHPRHCGLSDRCPVIVSFLFLPPETQKTRKSESRFAGFVSGPICPVDFIFMPQIKEQIKNILQKSSTSGSGKNSRLFSINYAIILPYDGPVR